MKKKLQEQPHDVNNNPLPLEAKFTSMAIKNMSNVNSSQTKQDTNNREQFQCIKKQFSKTVQSLQKQYKNNIMLYRDKYFKLSEAVIRMFVEANTCYEAMHTHSHQTQQSINHTEIQKDQKIIRQKSEIKSSKTYLQCKQLSQHSEPLSLVEYCINFWQQMCSQFETFHSRESKLRKEMLEMFTMSGNYNFLETVALKNLETHQLLTNNQELSLQLQHLQNLNGLYERTIQEYEIKFVGLNKDYQQIVVSIANMLKKCENNQIELKQQNRLQGQLLQSHKIQFERYKQNFKARPSFQQKQSQLRRILEKQYEDKIIISTKQIQRQMENKYRNHYLKEVNK